jgi:glycosyltransferase involved in cell wall biosynthesis
LENLRSILGDLRAEHQKGVFLLDASVTPSVSSFSFLQAAKEDNEDLAIIRATEVNLDGLILRPESTSRLIDNADEDGSGSRTNPRDFRRPELFFLRRQPIMGFSLAMLDVAFLEERLESFILSAEGKSTEPSLEGFWGFILSEAKGRTATHGCALAFPAWQKAIEGVRGESVKDNDLLGEPDPPFTIVVIDSQPPEPDKDSGSLVARRLMEYAISQMTRVFFISTKRRNSSHRGNLALASVGTRVLSEDFFPRVEDCLDFVSRHVDGKIVFVLNRVTSGGLYFDYVKRNFPSSRIIFNTVDLHGLRELRQASQSNDFKDFLLSTGTLRRELELARNSDATLVVSQSELEALSFKCPGADIRVLPLVCDFPMNPAPSTQRDQLLFLGSFLHPPNVDAVDFLTSEIWPAIRAKLSDVTLNLVGEELPHRVSNRLPDGISYLGHLAHLQAELERTRVTVAPLRFGAGAKGKIATSLAHGVPCVTTSIGAEGMGLVNGRDILIADTPTQFASVVRRLFDDPEFWTEMSQRGMQTAQRLWAIDAVGPVFMNIVSGKEIL